MVPSTTKFNVVEFEPLPAVIQIESVPLRRLALHGWLATLSRPELSKSITVSLSVPCKSITSPPNRT
jgi:hypothetical protein